MTRPLFITGTDTGVGKTVASLLLMRSLFRAGHLPFYWKPLQTGCLSPYDTDSDARFVYENCPELSGQDPAQSTEYIFAPPKAPRYAAQTGPSGSGGIDVEILLRRLASLRKTGAPLIIEGAGGLLVPVSEGCTMANVLHACDALPVIVARAGLGTINHTLLTIEALRHRNMEPAGIVFMNTLEHTTPDDLILENMEAVSTYSGISVSGVIPPITNFQSLPAEAWEVCGRLLQACGYSGIASATGNRKLQ